MAGDWIKMRTNLDTDPRVIEIAAHLGTTEMHVVGMLWKVWSWADTHSIDGNAIRVTCVTLDRFTCCTGFAEALRKVGWLEGRDNAISFPRFTEHNGQTAKKRAETKERVAKFRNAKSVTDVTQKVLPEKRREEKSITHTHTQARERSKIETQHSKPPEGLEADWQRWMDYREAIDGRPIDAIRADAMLMDLGRRGVEKAKRDIEFSILKGSKSILDSDNDFSAPRASASKAGPQTRHLSADGKTMDDIIRESRRLAEK